MQNLNKILLLLIFILLTPFTLADTGCFYYENSPLHCQTVDEVAAQEECSFFSSCILPAVFFPGTSCEDKTIFPHCEKVLCKGTCTEEWRGECLLGNIAPEEQPFWCSAGCCQFTSGNEQKCSFESNAGACESAARNGDATQFKFNSAISEFDCPTSCTTTGEGWISKVVSPLSILPAPFSNAEVSFFIPQNTTSTETSSSEHVIFWGLIIVILAGLAGGLAYYVHAHRKKPVSETKRETKIESLNLFSPFQSDAKVKEHIETLHHHLEHKKKETEREEVMTVFAGLEKPFQESSVDKLEKVVKHHKPVAIKPVPVKTESAITKLKTFINKK